MGHFKEKLVAMEDAESEREDIEVMMAEAAYDAAAERGEICPGCDCSKTPAEELCSVCCD